MRWGVRLDKKKRFKDPIYGYIDIDETIISDIVDTAGFQRLRNVIQTSYSPLYSSAVHYRFVHSLGVFHLGCIVSKSTSADKDEFVGLGKIERYLEVFELACLLHDLGHAPFSHTGEDFYLENGKRDLLHNVIIKLTLDNDLEEETKSKNYKAAPHELMSVIVALKDYGFLFRDYDEKSFFARCIIGYPYAFKEGELYSFLNCIISLLNSAVIDVDKLDYLIRACERDIESALRLLETTTTNKENMEAMVAEKEKHLQWLKVLKTFAEEQNMDFDFVILKANQFNSGFAKDVFARIRIEFNTLSRPCFFGKVTNTLKAEKSYREKFFYLFYRRKAEDNKIDFRRLAVILGTIAMQEAFNDN